MLEIRVGLLALSLTVCATAIYADDDEDETTEKAVDYRQGLMEVFSYNAGSMRDMVKGNTPFDATAFARYAKDLAAATQLDLLAGFPENSNNDDSDASDGIWEEWDKFQEHYRALQDEAAKLTEVAAGGDEATIKEQLGKTAKTCKSCHDKFQDE